MEILFSVCGGDRMCRETLDHARIPKVNYRMRKERSTGRTRWDTGGVYKQVTPYIKRYTLGWDLQRVIFVTRNWPTTRGDSVGVPEEDTSDHNEISRVVSSTVSCSWRVCGLEAPRRSTESFETKKGRPNSRGFQFLGPCVDTQIPKSQWRGTRGTCRGSKNLFPIVLRIHEGNRRCELSNYNGDFYEKPNGS